MVNKRIKYCSWLTVSCAAFAIGAAVPTLAQTANYGELSVAVGFAQVRAEGRTAGFYGLSNIVDRDRNGNLCLGYADTTPDHVLRLEQDFDQLTLTIASGEDTTLLVQGPNDNTVRCNDNADRRNADAQITDSWLAGTYRVWVGSFDQEQRHNYVLTVSE
ncbi:MAG: hypothetical protein AAFY78_20345 [Cyanobacteria bacterium J06648_16]